MELLLIKGGGHSWPGGRGKDGLDRDGGSSALRANEEAWSFAKRFSKKG